MSIIFVVFSLFIISFSLFFIVYWKEKKQLSYQLTEKKKLVDDASILFDDINNEDIEII